MTGLLLVGCSSGTVSCLHLGPHGSTSRRVLGRHAGRVTGACLLPWQPPEHVAAAAAVVPCARTASFFATCSTDACIKLWTSDGKALQATDACVQALRGHRAGVTSLAAVHVRVCQARTGIGCSCPCESARSVCTPRSLHAAAHPAGCPHLVPPVRQLRRPGAAVAGRACRRQRRPAALRRSHAGTAGATHAASRREHRTLTACWHCCQSGPASILPLLAHAAHPIFCCHSCCRCRPHCTPLPTGSWPWHALCS